ncbi:MAG: hypothetical protein GWP61_12030 [Chloroflexi bacterium]|nr:hypothetical protein [Chloroflexota bacterium]
MIATRFVKPGGGWSGTLTQDTKLTAGDSAELDHFGISVANSTNMVLAGAMKVVTFTTTWRLRRVSAKPITIPTINP